MQYFLLIFLLVLASSFNLNNHPLLQIHHSQTKLVPADESFFRAVIDMAYVYNGEDLFKNAEYISNKLAQKYGLKFNVGIVKSINEDSQFAFPNIQYENNYCEGKFIGVNSYQPKWSYFIMKAFVGYFPKVLSEANYTSEQLSPTDVAALANLLHMADKSFPKSLNQQRDFIQSQVYQKGWTNFLVPIFLVREIGCIFYMNFGDHTGGQSKFAFLNNDRVKFLIYEQSSYYTCPFK